MSESADATAWSMVALSDVCEQVDTTNPTTSPDAPFKYVDVSSVSNETFRILDSKELLGKDAPSRARQVIKKNDVIFATVRPVLRRVALVPAKLDGEVCSTGFCVLRAKSTDLDPQFLYYYLLSDSVRVRVEALQTGATYPAINDSDLFRLEVPLPPLSDQQAIARILETVQRAKEFRHRELALGYEQKAALAERLFDPNTTGEGSYSSSRSGWNVLKFGDLMQAGLQNGIYKPQNMYGTGVAIVRINDFDNDGNLMSPTLQRVNIDKAESELYGLNNGDILINRVNSLSHLGKSLLVRNLTEPTVFESNMMRLKVDESRVLSTYVSYYLLTDAVKLYIKSRAKRAVAQSSVNQGDIRSIAVPFPSLSEQKYIVTTLEACARKLRALQREVELLGQFFAALVEELVSGKLVPHAA